MAYPFGGHPTLGSYLIWARDTHGFRAQTGYGADPEGRPYTSIRIYKEGGPSIVLVDYDQSERLPPTMVYHLDRRLGIKSSFASLGDED